MVALGAQVVALVVQARAQAQAQVQVVGAAQEVGLDPQRSAVKEPGQRG